MSRVIDPRYFAAVPGRAVRDKDISGLQFRALAAIAGHDRMGRNGQGCWAGRKAMAERIGCTETSFSEAVSWLVKNEYIEVMLSETDGRKRGYRVVYQTAEDAKGIGAKLKADRSADADVSDRATGRDRSASADVNARDRSASADVSARNRSAKGDQSAPRQYQKDQVDQVVRSSVRKPNIFPEREENIPLKQDTSVQKDEAPKTPNPKMQIMNHWYAPEEVHEAWDALKRLPPFQWNRFIGLWKKGELTAEDRDKAEKLAFAEMAEKSVLN